ncbi:hypothetical protein PV10_08478 [Exophiala mesophila]|uniref:Uncharacterized protein n=1 Tax=Exophiala mesophila TaxID=212818 RepID=A0A0D1WIY6_EXOME|nr:uncharacterized protein PV10_08478 [Exophiala mesophila]KIV88840.1 hypothetical protein PV10_08478 [Exophiala mesophila]
MSTTIPRRAGFVCRSCQKSLASKPQQNRYLSSFLSSKPQPQHPPRRQGSAVLSSFRRNYAAKSAGASRRIISSQPTTITENVEAEEEDEVEGVEENATELLKFDTLSPPAVLRSIQRDVANITSSTRVPSESTISILLDLMFQFSNILVFGINKGPSEVETKEGEDLADSVLRDLAEGKSDEKVFIPDREISQAFRDKAANTVAELAWTLMRDPKIFITEDLLNIYTRVQCLLGKPEYLPEIFNLYATKKVPIADSSPVRYSEPWSKMPRYAVPLQIAESALEAAILKKNLPLALAVIDTTVATPAFRNKKLLLKASLPIAGVSALPVLAYGAASWMAANQNTMDYEMSKWTAMACAAAYIGTLSTIGFVAITTSNDQMERVVWRPGTSLNSRWIREEEREFFDRLALAWGFQNKSRWGEEQGQDWQVLRDECGCRSMVLDKTDLMEGMQ